MTNINMHLPWQLFFVRFDMHGNFFNNYQRNITFCTWQFIFLWNGKFTYITMEILLQHTWQI